MHVQRRESYMTLFQLAPRPVVSRYTAKKLHRSAAILVNFLHNPYLQVTESM